MNKKILTICLIAVLTLSVICFASCKGNAADKLREINSALIHEYSKIELAVTITDDEVTLKSNYVMSKSGGITEISYRVDRLNTFDANGEIPSEMITTVAGNAKYDGKAITSIDGDEVDYEVLRDVVDCNMAFRLSYLNDINVLQNGITAKVIDPKGFFENDKFEGTDMSVNVKMANSLIATISIHYSLNGTAVTMDYTFDR